MNELEMEIGRNYGASCFFVYQTIKHNPGLTRHDLHLETGMSEDGIHRILKVLMETNIIQLAEKTRARNRRLSYKENAAKETWKFH